MHSKSPEIRLRDIAENISAIREFTAGMDATGLAADRKTLYAVVRALEIISEATRRLPAEMKARHASIDWTAIAAAGNVYRHEYEGRGRNSDLEHGRARSAEAGGCGDR